MSGTLLVAGTGKMGRNAGLHFARNGWRVGWLSRDGARLAAAERWLRRRLRKLGDPCLGFFLPGAPDLPGVDMVLEAVEEDPAVKAALLTELEGVIPGAPPRLLSTTSSLLPGALHPRLDVAHFFYPLELTRLVELVPGEGRDGVALAALLGGLGLQVVRQNRRSAFLLNRLLLPLQREAMAEVLAGAPPERVDERTAASLLCPLGQLSLMDAVGLDTVQAAAAAYVGRLPEAGQRIYRPLLRGLERALAEGRRGTKSGSGLLAGEPVRWGAGSPASRPGEQYAALMAVTCRRAVELGLIQEAVLDDALARILGAEVSLAAEEERLGPPALASAGGLSYFRVDAGDSRLSI